MMAANDGALPRLDQRGANPGGGFVFGDLGELESRQLLALRSRLTRGIGTRSILGDETLQLFLLCLNRRVHPQVVLTTFLLIF